MKRKLILTVETGLTDGFYSGEYAESMIKWYQKSYPSFTFELLDYDIAKDLDVTKITPFISPEVEVS